MRQTSDPVLAQFIIAIADRAPTQAEIDCTFYTGDINCHIAAEDVLSIVDADTSILCTHVADTVRYNADIMHKLYGHNTTCVCSESCTCSALHTVLPGTNAIGVQELQPWLNEPSGKFHKIPFVALGARVLLTDAVDRAHGAVNATAGIVVALHLKDKAVHVIDVRMECSGYIVGCRRSFQTSTTSAGKKYDKATFPMQLAYAITAHKAQGATMAALTIVHAGNVFCRGQLYAVLSRKPNRTTLRIVGHLLADQFQPVVF